MVSYNPQQAWDLKLSYGSSTLELKLARGASGSPIQFEVNTAPTLQDAINTSQELTYSSTPPAQGKTQAITSVKKGAGKKDWKDGHYAFGESIETEDGFVRPGPLVSQTTVNGATVLDGFIVKDTLHNDGNVYIAAGRRIYYWDYTNQYWAIVNAPAWSTSTITDLLSFSGKLYVFFGTSANMGYSSDNGVTWTQVPGFTSSSDSKVSFGAIREQRSTRPKLMVLQQPDLTFEAEDPTLLSSWTVGNRVGQEASTLDAFTSLAIAPDGTPMFGKKTGWRSMDAFGNIDIKYPTRWPSSGQGTPNFANPVVGPRGNLYTVVHDYDILELSQGSISPGFGPARIGKGVPEMEKAVVALAGDADQHLFVALAGASGYVMKGLYNEDDGYWNYHGAYIKVGVALTCMWLAIDPNDNQLYLWMAPTATPFRPYRALIPRENIDTDTNARFVATANIRYGWHDNGFANDTKVSLQAMPVTRNLLTGTRSVQLLYREDSDSASFTAIGTYVDSPEPANTVDTYFPTSATGKRVELKAILTNSSSAGQAIIDRIIARHLTQHLCTNIITAMVLAEKGQLTRVGGKSDVSGQGMKDELNLAWRSIYPPLLTDENGRTWNIKIIDLKEISLKKSDMAFQIVMLEIPTIQSIAHSVGGVSHTHRLDVFTGDAATLAFTLTYPPIGPLLVEVGTTYQIEGTDFTRAGSVVTFTSAPILSASIHIYYMS